VGRALHTPNHRWVGSLPRALGRRFQLTLFSGILPTRRRIAQWLGGRASDIERGDGPSLFRTNAPATITLTTR